MDALRHHTLHATGPSRLRVGIKWDALARDELGESYGVFSAQDARKEILSIHKETSNLRLQAKILRFFFFEDKALQVDRAHDNLLDRKKDLERYIADEKLLSFDLDLCCFCYNRAGKMIKCISPVSTESADILDKPLAFMHTGDDDTGTGDAYDEEILVNLSAIESEIDRVFFVILSVNHGFDQVKGGFWSIIKTLDETVLMSVKMRASVPDRIHVMAKLARDGNAWALEEIAEFCPLGGDEEDMLPERIDRLLAERYVTNKV